MEKASHSENALGLYLTGPRFPNSISSPLPDFMRRATSFAIDFCPRPLHKPLTMKQVNDGQEPETNAEQVFYPLMLFSQLFGGRD